MLTSDSEWVMVKNNALGARQNIAYLNPFFLFLCGGLPGWAEASGLNGRGALSGFVRLSRRTYGSRVGDVHRQPARLGTTGGSGATGDG